MHGSSSVERCFLLRFHGRRSRVRNYGGNRSLRLFRHFKEAIYRFFVAKRRRGKLAHDRPINSVSCSSAATSSENSFARFFPSSPPPPSSPDTAAVESVHFVGNLVGIKSWFRRRNNRFGFIINLNFNVRFFFFLFLHDFDFFYCKDKDIVQIYPLQKYHATRKKKIFLLRFFRAINWN